MSDPGFGLVLFAVIWVVALTLDIRRTLRKRQQDAGERGDTIPSRSGS